jgi:hypothetical protein
MASRRRASKRNVGTRIADLDARLKRTERAFSPQYLGSAIVYGSSIASGSITATNLDSNLSGSLLDAISGSTENGGSAENALISAETAANAAANAQLSANGKNTIYYQTAAPTGGTYTVNDVWFDTDDGFKMYIWNGTAWTASVFGNSALGALDVGKLTAGTINASLQIIAGTVANGTSRVVIDGGGSGDAGIRLISRSAGGVDTTLVNLSATTGSATFTGSITASSGTIGGFTISASTLSATNFLLDTSAQTIRLGPSGTGTASVLYATAGSGIWLGNHTFASAPFRVSLAGALTATNATVTGTIQATAGYIGSSASNGWVINSDFLRSQGGSKQLTLDGTNARMYIAAGTGTHATAGTDFYADATGLFSIRDKLIFNPGTTDTSGFATLTVIGRIRGAIDNVPIIEPDSGQFTVTTAVISGTSPAQTAVVTTSLTHNFAIGDTVIIEKVTGLASVINGAWRITNKTSTTFTIDGISGATNGTYTGLSASGSICRVRELTIGLHPSYNGSPAGLGIRLDEFNYWFVNNQFRAGNSSTWVKWDGTTFEVQGQIKALSGYIGGSTSGWQIQSNLLSNANIGLYAPSTTTVTTTTSGSTAPGTTTLNITSATGVVVGMSVTCTNIPTGTYVASIVGTAVTLSAAVTGTGPAAIPAGTSVTFAEYGLYAGNATRQLAPFRVDYRGNLVANNAAVSGTLTATGGNLGPWLVSGTPAAQVTRTLVDPRFTTLTGAFIENKTTPSDISTTPGYVSLSTGTFADSLAISQRLDGLLVHNPNGDPFYTAYLGTSGFTITSPDRVNLIENGGLENYNTNTSVLTSWATTGVAVGATAVDYATALTGVNIFTSSNPTYYVNNGQWGGRLTWTASNPGGFVRLAVDGATYNKYYGTSNPDLNLSVDLFYTFSLNFVTVSTVTVTATTMTVTTTTSHGYAVGDVVSFACYIYDDNSQDFGTGQFVIQTINSATQFTVRNNVAIDQGVDILGTITVFPATGSANPLVARVYPAYMDLDDAKIRFANNTTLSLYSVLPTVDQPNWSAENGTRYLFTSWLDALYFNSTAGDLYAGQGVGTLGLSNLAISMSKLKTLAGANWDGISDFYIELPAYMYRAAFNDNSSLGSAPISVRTGPYTITSASIATTTTGSVTFSVNPNTPYARFRVNDTLLISGLTGNAAVMNGLRTITSVSGATISISGFTGGVVGTYTGLSGTAVSKVNQISGVTYGLVYDSASFCLSTAGFFAGDFAGGTGDYSWAGTAYASASIKVNKPFIDFAKINNAPIATASLSNLDTVSFKPSYSKPVGMAPYVGVPVGGETYILGAVEVNSLESSSGTFTFQSSPTVQSTLETTTNVFTSSNGTGFEVRTKSFNDGGATDEDGVLGILTTTSKTTFYIRADDYQFTDYLGNLNFKTGATYLQTNNASSATSRPVRGLYDGAAISRSYNNTSGTNGSIGYGTPSNARSIVFKAPASGIVAIHITARMDNSVSGGRCYYAYEIRTGTTSAGAIKVSPSDVFSVANFTTNTTIVGSTHIHQLVANTDYFLREQMNVWSNTGTSNTATCDTRRIFVQPIY